MKKTDKKLRLSRETLRSLDRSGLSRVQGGGPGGPKTTLPNTMVTSCDYTYSCPELCQISQTTIV